MAAITAAIFTSCFNAPPHPERELRGSGESSIGPRSPRARDLGENSGRTRTGADEFLECWPWVCSRAWDLQSLLAEHAPSARLR